jgi:hypothetical protein
MLQCQGQRKQLLDQTFTPILISGVNICLDAPLSRKYDDLQSAA